MSTEDPAVTAPHARAPAEARATDVVAESAPGSRLLLGWFLIALAALLLFLGWLGVSGQPKVARQLAYLASGGIGGLLAGIVGVGLLVSDDVRRDRERLGRVEAALLETRELLAAQAQVIERLHALLEAREMRNRRP